MVTSLIRPSYQNNFYSRKRGGIPANGGLWPGLVSAIYPGLGNTGMSIPNWGRRENSGTLTNMTSADWVISPDGYVLDYDGSNDHITIGSGPRDIYNFTPNVDEFTLVAWIKIASGQTGTIICRAAGTGSGPRQYQLYVSGNTLYAVVGGTVTNSGVTVADNIWHCVALTNFNDAGTLKHKFTVDGIEDDTIGTSGSSTQATTLLIGARRTTAPDTGVSFLFTGQIGNTLVFNRALKLSEMQLLTRDPFALFRLRQRMWKAPVAVGGRIMSSLANYGGLVGLGGIAGQKGGLAA